MSLKSRTVLKSYFETNDTPTEGNFEDLIDSAPNFVDDNPTYGFNWTGDYDNAISYVKYDSVYYDTTGASYVCIEPHDSSQAPTETTYWEKIVEKGGIGDTGEQGIQGETGDTGPTGADSTVAGPKGDTGDTGPVGELTQATADTLYAPVLGADDNYVTDAEKTVIGNTSNENTGDQTISDATISITDIATNNFTTTAHGFVPKGTNVGNYLKDDGTWATVSGSGDVVGPASSTNDAIARFDTTTGKLLQNSSVTINDGGGIYVPGGIEGGNTYINGNISLTGDLFNRTTGLELINFTSTSSAVNEIGIKNNITGNSPEIQATGDDTNIDLKLVAKGSGILNVGTNVSIQGTLLERISTPEGLYIKDSYNNKMLLVYSNSATAAVNYISIMSEATGNSPNISAGGADTDVSLKLSAKNAGTIDLDNEMNAGTNSIGFTMQTATGDGTTTIDWKLGNHIDFTFGAFNETFTFTAPSNPGVYTISLKQDSVGSRTATWPATVKWPAGTAPTLTTTASTGYDLIAFRYDGTNYYGTSTLDFS